ncbi:hypothetical protein QF030_001378 [Streptomyces rishiriensis]|uniref:Uncharacterized protein n=1 Tax=Streptomyces rishiriensis TaxID=68264 RepID=A0ABU0NJA0_STRRH|nr:hypothetical protein [Streptomyces rishiriensis]
MTLFLLASVLVLVYADGRAGRTTVLRLPPTVTALVAGWYAIRRDLALTHTSSRADA